jgi:hypothetical protein
MLIAVIFFPTAIKHRSRKTREQLSNSKFLAECNDSKNSFITNINIL